MEGENQRKKYREKKFKKKKSGKKSYERDSWRSEHSRDLDFLFLFHQLLDTAEVWVFLVYVVFTRYVCVRNGCDFIFVYGLSGLILSA